MPVGVKVGPVYATSRGGSRRKRRKQYTPMQGVAVLWLIAVVYLLVSGGWLVVLGWALVAAGLIMMCVRLAHSKPGVQHAGGGKPKTKLPADTVPLEDETSPMAVSDRR